MAGAHVSGSPFRLAVVEGAVAANASLAYGVGIDSPLAGGVFGTSVFTIRRGAKTGLLFLAALQCRVLPVCCEREKWEHVRETDPAERDCLCFLKTSV